MNARPDDTRVALSGEVLSLGRALIGEAPWRCAAALLLLLAAGVTEAFGLVMIIPLLHVAGLAGHSGEPGLIVEAVARGAEWLGVALTLPVMLGVFLVLAAARSAVAWQRNVLLTRVRLEFVDGIRERLHAAVAAAKWEHLLARRQSDIQHLLTSEVNRIGQGASLLLQCTVTVVLAAVQLAVALAIAPLVSLAALCTGAVLLLLARPLVRRSRDLGEQLTGSGRALHASVSDFLTGLKLAKIHAAEPSHARHFSETVALMRRRQLAFTTLAAAARAGLDMGAAAALAALVWLSLSIAALTAPELLILALIFARVTPALFRLQQNVQQLAHVLPAYAHAQEAHQELRAAAEARAGDDAPPMSIGREIEVRNVSFAYACAAGRPVLAGIDLTIPANRMIAIAGPTGAGKSTLADLLLGLIEPSAGEIRVDGTPLAGTRLRRWRRSVACVPQEPYLFHDTVRANLSWATPQAKEAQMWRALRFAAVEEAVATLPRGLDTVVGDRGARLSGGERQRITLARALLAKPALLVLDEATSQLDPASEGQVLAALRYLREHMTIVVVAHRAALLRSADRIIVLESGRVVAAGALREVARELAAFGIDAGEHGV